MNRAMPLLLMLIVAGGSGCVKSPRTIEAAFPRGIAADPWALVDDVWTGPALRAASAIGDDWKRIEPHHPGRAWLAVYRHERDPERTVTVRAFQFDSPRTARRVFDAWRPEDAPPFKIGDAGCFTDIGVMFVWGDTFFDIFANKADWNAQMQAAYLTGFIENKLPPPDAGQE